LRDDLRALFGGGPAVRDEVDRAILDEAQRRLSRTGPTVLRGPWARLALPAAAAVALVATVSIILVARQPAPRPSVAMVRIAEDIDADGAVTVLDAFTIARAVRTAAPASPAWDVTHDGAIDRADIDHIMTVAVALPPDAPLQRGPDGGAMQ
jgi:hypothetical protein